MKADREDGPAFLRPQKKNHLPFILAFITTSTVFWILVALYGKPIVVDLNMLWGAINPKKAAPVAEATYQSQFPEFEEIKPNKTAEELFWASVNEKQLQQPKVRQTEFNDNNYTPKQAANIVTAQASPQANTYQNSPQQSRTTQNRTVDYDSHWIDKWSGGARYLAKWTAINNYIDGTTVCANHKRGSINYRECRKGAKQYFKEQCRAWDDRWENDRSPHSDRMKQRYCVAASSFNPMG
jgi:hypothetical protein